MTEFSKKIPLARDSTLEQPRSWWDKQMMEQAQRKPAQSSSWSKSPPGPNTRFRVTNMDPSVAFFQGARPYREIGAGWGRPDFAPTDSNLAHEVRNYLAQPVDRVGMMVDTVNDAFRRISSGGPDERYVSGLSSEFARVHKLPDFSKGQWKPAYSLHSSDAYEHVLPGSSGMVLKVYLKDDELGGQPTATITSPTLSADHIIGTMQYEAGNPVNEEHAKQYIRGILDSDRRR